MKSVTWLLLFALKLSPLAHGIKFPTPLPTDTQSPTSKPPWPTAGLQLKQRDTVTTDRMPYAGILSDPKRGGWIDTTVFGTDDEFHCANTEASFVFHDPNAEFTVGMHACCTHNECDFASTCYDYAQIKTNPSVTTSKDPFIRYCTESEIPECGTWIYPGAYIKMECRTEAFSRTVYTEAKWSNRKYTAARSVTQELQTTDDQFMNYISFTIMTDWGSDSTSTSSSGSSHVLPKEPSPSTTLQTPQPSATDTEKSNSSTSPGAIAGGVVGGLVGGAAIAAAAIFFFLRRKKKIRQENEPSEELQETGYQAVPQNQPRHSSWLMPHVAEPESTYKPETSEPSTTGATPELYSPNSPAELPERHHR